MKDVRKGVIHIAREDEYIIDNIVYQTIKKIKLILLMKWYGFARAGHASELINECPAAA